MSVYEAHIELCSIHHACFKQNTVVDEDGNFVEFHLDHSQAETLASDAAACAKWYDAKLAAVGTGRRPETVLAEREAMERQERERRTDAVEAKTESQV